MPIYEYKCESCGKCFEKLILSSEDERSLVCPQCGDQRIGRQMSCSSAFNNAKGNFCASGSANGFS